MASTLADLSASRLFNLSGAIALVTGGGTGIGLFCARALAANGARVYITGRRGEALRAAADEHSAASASSNGASQQQHGGQLVPLQLDVTDKQQLQQAAEEIKRKDGKLHILINNAGIAGPITQPHSSHPDVASYARAHLSSEEMSAWDDVQRTNVTAPFFCTMALLPLLEAGNAAPPTAWQQPEQQRASFAPWSAAVINVTSISGIVKQNQNHYAYNISKAAANHLTAMLSHELHFSASGPRMSIRVNAIAPGVFPSEMTTGGTSGNDGQKGAGVTSVHTHGLQDKAGPPGRTGCEEEMANLCLMLSTNTYVHGQIVAIDGGYTAAVSSTR